MRPRAGHRQKIRLVAKAKISDDLAVPFDVRALEVVEQPTTTADHLQQALPAVMILGVGTEVTGQVVDVIGENRDLDLRRPGIGVVRAVLLDCWGLLKCHVAVFSARAARWVSLDLRKPIRIPDVEAPVKAPRVLGSVLCLIATKSFGSINPGTS